MREKKRHTTRVEWNCVEGQTENEMGQIKMRKTSLNEQRKYFNWFFIPKGIWILRHDRLSAMLYLVDQIKYAFQSI